MFNALANILQSASKIVFIMLATSACAALFTHVIESKDFMVLASMAFGFYFASKPADPSAGSGVK